MFVEYQINFLCVHKPQATVGDPITSFSIKSWRFSSFPQVRRPRGLSTTGQTPQEGVLPGRGPAQESRPHSWGPSRRHPGEQVCPGRGCVVPQHPWSTVTLAMCNCPLLVSKKTEDGKAGDTGDLPDRGSAGFFCKEPENSFWGCAGRTVSISAHSCCRPGAKQPRIIRK